MKKIAFTVVISILMHNYCLSQLTTRNTSLQITSARDTVLEPVRTKEIKDSISFYPPKLPALGQIAGAPLSFYTYFWELGDGTFSFNENPVHIYKDSGTYIVRLFVTNNFDDGRAPIIKPYPVHVNKKPQVVVKKPSYFFNANINGNVGMKNNRDPLPGEDFVTVIGYRNKLVENLRGSLVIFYNEKQFESKNFAMADKRFYNQEESSTLNKLLSSLLRDKTTGEEMLAARQQEVNDYEENELINKQSIQAPNEKTTVSTEDALTIEKKYEERSFSSLTSQLPEIADGNTANKEVGIATDNNGNFKEGYIFKNTASPVEDTKNFYIDAAANNAGKNYNPGNDTRSILQLLKKDYTDNAVFRFENLSKGDENFVFMTMNASPQMLQDTDAVITLTAVMIPDDPFIQPEKFELEMQVVASHDPNRFMLKNHRINYRFFKTKKELTYRVRFENTGKGPARKVSIGIGIPKQLNAASFQVKKISPACAWCQTARVNQSCIDTLRTADSIFFTFKNIYIPGVQQRTVKDKDSTRGFVEYSIRFKKKPKKIPFGNRASIVFDKNEPIYTNRAMGRFKKGVSPGIVAGYNFSLSNVDYSAKGPIQIGYVLSPFSPYRPYFQVEAYLGLLQNEDSTGVTIYDDPPPFSNNTKYRIVQQETKLTRQRNSINVVPLHFRYNINNWIGIGLGAMAQIVITEKVTMENKIQIFEIRYLPNQSNYRFDSTVVITSQPVKNSFKSSLSNSNVAAFADLQIGRVRTGPTLGLRYLRQLRGNIPNQFFVYAAIKI